jgi:hypothetical protein
MAGKPSFPGSKALHILIGDACRHDLASAVDFSGYGSQEHVGDF